MSGRRGSGSAAEFVWVGVPGLDLDAESAAILAAEQPGGIVLFGRNCPEAHEPERLANLVADLRRVLPQAIVAVDAEGGRVDRFRAAVGSAPGARALALAPPSASLEVGYAIGRSLALFGLDVDLAPVVDLDRGRVDNALDRRYLGSEPHAVIARGREFLSGLHAAGVGGCLKHFPGLGAAEMDTHRAGAAIELSAHELERDLEPFAALAPLAGAILVSHAVYRAFGPELRPATLSPAVDRRLRQVAGEGILSLSDDLEMGALAPWGDYAERGAASFAAGCDVLLLCKDLHELPHLVRRLEAPALAERRAAAERRLARYRARLLAWSDSAASLERSEPLPPFATRVEAVRERFARLRERLLEGESGS